ncbi:hypothetical protein [Mycobacteroides abscessus]|uniref:hypothetical protein n=1 Tax=Mycobacteroides abscessus TaxID=36809 RepID=UPI0009A5A562|nr:hypothetical protein [Mycobacteroides abscessus]SLC86540.1 Uncharacterised protein [Mycobacteroides abscessus subsp. abscessus]SLG74780.1 Uncharacterised protein [Mycobacteroides abscessus subsp. abscessus]
MSAGPNSTHDEESGGGVTVFLLPHPELRGALKFLATALLTAFYAVNAAVGAELEAIPFILRATLAGALSALTWAGMKLARERWRAYRDYRRFGPYIERIASKEPPLQGDSNG